MIIKICGITSIDDALCVQRSGAHMIGFVFAPSPRHVSVQQALQIISGLSGALKTVGVFTQPREDILEILKLVPLDLVQLHGDQPEGFTEELGSDRVIRAIRVRDAVTLDTAKNHQGTLLLDAYSPDAAGGTGLSFDWRLLVGYPRDYMLSGGLTPANVGEAVLTLKPYGLDVSSGVELSPGVKNHKLIEEFIQNANRAE